MQAFMALTTDQVLELLAQQPKLRAVPGVALVWVDFVGPGRTDLAVVASVYAGQSHDVSQLPVRVAQLPVIVNVVDPDTMRVVEVIDPRRSGGAWPPTNHRNPSGI
jgi:hypothetical protein